MKRQGIIHPHGESLSVEIIHQGIASLTNPHNILVIDVVIPGKLNGRCDELLNVISLEQQPVVVGNLAAFLVPRFEA